MLKTCVYIWDIHILYMYINGLTIYNQSFWYKHLDLFGCISSEKHNRKNIELGFRCWPHRPPPHHISLKRSHKRSMTSKLATWLVVFWVVNVGHICPWIVWDSTRSRAAGPMLAAPCAAGYEGDGIRGALCICCVSNDGRDRTKLQANHVE